METNIIYKYRAPGASPGDDVTITAVSMELDPRFAEEGIPHPVGETVTLQADDPDEFGEGPRDYEVLQRWPMMAQFGDTNMMMSLLFVIVTDPNA